MQRLALAGSQWHAMVQLEHIGDIWDVALVLSVSVSSSKRYIHLRLIVPRKARRADSSVKAVAPKKRSICCRRRCRNSSLNTEICLCVTCMGACGSGLLLIVSLLFRVHRSHPMVMNGMMANDMLDFDEKLVFSSHKHAPGESSSQNKL